MWIKGMKTVLDYYLIKGVNQYKRILTNDVKIQYLYDSVGTVFYNGLLHSDEWYQKLFVEWLTNNYVSFTFYYNKYYKQANAILSIC